MRLAKLCSMISMFVTRPPRGSALRRQREVLCKTCAQGVSNDPLLLASTHRTIEARVQTKHGAHTRARRGWQSAAKLAGVVAAVIKPLYFYDADAQDAQATLLVLAAGVVAALIAWRYISPHKFVAFQLVLPRTALLV